ncbi:MAG: CocE/NonD family hydrolase [Eubacterium sp.]|nr:CocE/NonD family hydrolase [Eubacterium sp.]
MNKQRKIVKHIFNGEEIDVIFDPVQRFPGVDHPGVKMETRILKKGSHNAPVCKPLDCDMIFDRDVPIELRDGVVVFADVFRPVGSEKVPAIIAYSPYGKQKHSNYLPWGVPESKLSGLQKDEAPDPGFWVPRGYAVVQPDTRGVFFSGGDNYSFGSAEARDGYDIVEWAAAQDWCSGKVGMSGNSYLAISQFLIASLNPPHLAAIAPWEGFNDVYRQTSLAGGIPNFAFQKLVDQNKEGFGWYENMAAMAEKYPLMNAYWEDKRTKIEDIRVPAYIVGSYISSFHSYGTLESLQRMASEDKWLRIHNTHEWPDLYDEENEEDLCRFFDYYLKGIENGWKDTPKVRLSVLNPGGEDVVNRTEKDFPLPDTQYTNLYLDNTNGGLTYKAPGEAVKAEYTADNRKDMLIFKLPPMEKRTEIIGYFGAHLYVEAEDTDDLDLFVYALKTDKDGNWLPPIVHGAPFSGFEGAPRYTPCGRLRASRRETDPEMSTEAKPFQTFRTVCKLTPGEPVRVDIPLWPMGMVYEEGQQLIFIVSSYELNMEEWPGLEVAATVNRGKAAVWSGGDKASYITVPFIPER